MPLLKNLLISRNIHFLLFIIIQYVGIKGPCLFCRIVAKKKKKLVLWILIFMLIELEKNGVVCVFFSIKKIVD